MKKLKGLVAILTIAAMTACGTDISNGEIDSQNDQANASGLFSGQKNAITKDANFLTFFSNTYDGDSSVAKKDENNPDKRFIKFVNETERTLDICVFEIDSEDITAAIIKAHQRGVRVRMVVDSQTTEKSNSTKRLRDAGITVVDDGGRVAYMHNKFAISDATWVWTGSYNLTNSASWKHNDNVIKIKSPYMCANYITEFEEMFIDRKFGRTSPNNIKHRTIHVSADKNVTTLFAPEDDVIGAIIKEVSKSKKSIKFMGFSFTHDALANALIERSKKGIKISGIFESLGSSSDHSAYGKLLNENINLYIKKPAQAKALMHHKVFIIDDKVTVTGSFNFSKNASVDNDENVLLIYSTTVANDYSQEFERVKDKSINEQIPDDATVESLARNSLSGD